MNTQDAALHIDVYSDVICPWCYVGKRRLERALRQVAGRVNVEVAWRPFQLNPMMPKDGMDRTAYLQAKFGTVDAYGQLEEQVSAAGSAEGMSFAFEKITRTPNTFLAHRLIWYAGLKGRQDAVVDQLFKGYFEEGLDIGSALVAGELANRTGLQADQFLTSEAGTAEVKAEELVGHQLGIRGVPYFVLEKTYGISGAQPVEVILSALEKARMRLSTASRS
ncbi:MAG: DsbA family oxidoreductase [Nitrospira sp.]|nr:DsbA family oxidoreductase [Nitrospira sp.]